MSLSIGSLFAGIGGLELGLERGIPGARTAWQVERDPLCREVLKTHWPAAELFGDVRSVGAGQLDPVDIICGGFPCQDLSVAGKGAGIDGERSGLWCEYSRVVRELRPRYVVVENVPALRSRGLGDVLGSLASSGYDASWDCLPASAVGAHHARDRLFVVAWDASNTNPVELRIEPERDEWQGWRVRAAVGRDAEPLDGSGWDGWDTRPGMVRVDDGFPAGLDDARNAALGNAVAPAVAAAVGRCIAASLAACAYCEDTGEAWDPQTGEGPACPACFTEPNRTENRTRYPRHCEPRSPTGITTTATAWRAGDE